MATAKTMKKLLTEITAPSDTKIKKKATNETMLKERQNIVYGEIESEERARITSHRRKAINFKTRSYHIFSTFEPRPIIKCFQSDIFIVFVSYFHLWQEYARIHKNTIAITSH